MTNQPNLITRHEIHTRPELWKDKIYYLERNPYWNKSYDFLPIPKKYAEIIQEFHQEIDKQKQQQEEAQKDKQEASQRINEIYKEIKEIIQASIISLENSPIIVEPRKIEYAYKVFDQIQQIILDIQTWFQSEYNFIQENPEERSPQREYKLEDLQPFLKETKLKKFKEWEKKWGPIIKTEWEPTGEELILPGATIEEPEGIDLLKKWQKLEGGWQPPTRKEEVEAELYKFEELEKQQKIKNLKLGLTKKNLGQFTKWANDNQIEEVEELLTEWKEAEEAIKKNYNSCFILEHTNEHLKFTFQPPRQIFVNLNEFLFYRSNTWYEVQSWERINNVNAVITCQRSKFLSYYIYFLSKGINGVLHNSPKIAQEICQCPSFLESTITEEYNCDWEPRYELWKISSAGGTKTAIPKDDDTYMPYLSSVSLKRVWDVSGWDSLSDTTYCILPKGYDDQRTWWSDTSSPEGRKITFTNKKGKQLTEEGWAERTNNELNFHTKKHVAVQLFWRKKLLGGPYSLKDFSLKECYLKLKANGASILYTLMSNNICLRWSEDIKTTIEKDKMVGIFSGVLNKFTGIALNEATNALFHDQNTEESKASEERESERKTKYTGASKVVSSVIASIPSMFASNHTKMDYTFAEVALRYEQPSLLIRLQYNNVLFDRYKMEKQLKRNGNEWVNWKKAGDYLNKKGYWKIVPQVFEGDKDGFFAAIFSKGVYLYEEHPHEYFEIKLEGGKYRNNILVGGNPQIESVFQQDLEETGGHDNISDRGGGLWVYKSSYIKRQDGTGGNYFETLMEKAYSNRNHSYESSDKWVFKHPQTWSEEITMDEYTTYVYDLHFFSSDHKNTNGVKGAKKIIAEQIAEGNRAAIKVKFIGELEIKQGQDDPNEIGKSLPGGDEVEEMPEIEREDNEELLNDLERQEEPEAEEGQEKQPEEELEPEPESQKEEEQQEELEQEEERTKEKTKEKHKEKQKEEEEEKEPEYSGDREK